MKFDLQLSSPSFPLLLIPPQKSWMEPHDAALLLPATATRSSLVGRENLPGEPNHPPAGRLTFHFGRYNFLFKSRYLYSINE